jgi:hypothetical protein
MPATIISLATETFRSKASSSYISSSLSVASQVRVGAKTSSPRAKEAAIAMFPKLIVASSIERVKKAAKRFKEAAAKRQKVV